MTEVARRLPAAPGHAPARFTGMGPDARHAAGPDYPAIPDSAAFVALRARFRRFVFPMTAPVPRLVPAYVLLAAYAHGFMGTQAGGAVTVGLRVRRAAVRLHRRHHLGCTCATRAARSTRRSPT